LEQIKKIMKEDFERDGYSQILMGDLNTSTLTAWGESNDTANNPEQRVQRKLLEEFDDIYLRDHEKNLGSRTEGAPKFLESDTQRMGLETLPEPTGSWYIGPYANSTAFVNAQMFKHSKKDQQKNKYTVTPDTVEVESPISWGTKDWRAKQPANTSRFDYILFPQYKDNEGKFIGPMLDGQAEIRRIVVPRNAQSAPSDHLPVDAQIWKLSCER
jgi:hypothetical protein